jgi:2-polyprenyl-3-methyl-5-hydroxy-6-metoxy-1,4-benzoquinol methylase
MGRFDDLAKVWDSNPQRVEGAMIFVDKVKEEIKEEINNFKVLDYGCGSGLVSFGFANDVKSIDGLDNSIGMIEVYNNKSKQIGLENICGSTHDINHQEIAPNTYDLIVTNMTMHHIDNPYLFVERLVKSLKSDGRIYIADLYLEDGTFHEDNQGVIHFGFEIKTIEDVFSKAGLEKIKIEKLHSINKSTNSYDVFIASGIKK